MNTHSKTDKKCLVSFLQINREEKKRQTLRSDDPCKESSSVYRGYARKRLDREDEEEEKKKEKEK